LTCIYAIIPYDTEQDLENIIAVEKIDKRFLGDDYEGKNFTGKQLCEDRGIELVYIPRKHSWSSSELKSRIKASELPYYNVDDLLRGPQ
jgi:glycerol-3-phosphate cytidylyltransferase